MYFIEYRTNPEFRKFVASAPEGHHAVAKLVVRNQRLAKISNVLGKSLAEVSSEWRDSVNVFITSRNKAALDRNRELIRQKKFLGHGSLDYLDLSTRAINILKHEKIRTIKQLLITTKRQLKNSPNCGLKTIKEIDDALAVYGLKREEVEKKAQLTLNFKEPKPVSTVIQTSDSGSTQRALDTILLEVRALQIQMRVMTDALGISFTTSMHEDKDAHVQ
jgi:hypothetical protein